MEKIFTPVGRVSFPKLFKPEGYQGSEPKYSMILVFEPEKFTPAQAKAYANMKTLADKVSMEKFKKKIAQLPANFKKPFRDGEEKADLAGFGAGKIFVTLSSKMRPGVVDMEGNPLPNATEAEFNEAFYPGCYARASITCYSYDNVGKGVAFGLQNVQFIRGGERLDSRTDAADDFAKAGDVDFAPTAEPSGDDFE